MVLKRLCVQALRLNGGYPRGSGRWAAARGLSSTPGSSAVEARTVAERTVGEPQWRPGGKGLAGARP